jgi:periplasmic divalent cation tolerance protein
MRTFVKGAPMKFFYVTLNNDEEAKKISLALLEKHIAICTNWFPINCCYRWEGEIVQEAEYVMIIKTKEDKRSDIEKVIGENIDYLNCIAEIDVKSINEKYGSWLASEVE